MMAAHYLTAPDMCPGPFFLGDDSSILRYWYGFRNNLTGVTMEVATYKGMYAAKMYSPAEDSPPQCCAPAARSRNPEALGSKPVPLWVAIRLEPRGRQSTRHGANELHPCAVRFTKSSKF